MRILAVFLALFLACSVTGNVRAETLSVEGRAAVLMDWKTGKILYQKNSNEPMPPASTTKILTALIALEKADLEEVITVGKMPPFVEGTRVYLVEGEKHVLKDLLYAMMLNSGNDASLAVAEHVGGSVEGFLKLMNQKAQELGAKNSRFANPHGLSEKGHHSTAYDLALITRKALENKEFRTIVATRTYPWKGKEWKTILVNQNKLLKGGEYSYEGAIGVKTGYTREAGQCLVAAARRGETTYIAVVLDSRGNHIWQDARKLLDYGFNNYKTEAVINKGDKIGGLATEAGRVELQAAKDLYCLVPKNGYEGLPSVYLNLKKIESPLAAGSPVGTLVYAMGEDKIGEVDLVAANNIASNSFKKWWMIISTALLIAVVSGRAISFFKERRNKKYFVYRKNSFLR